MEGNQSRNSKLKANITAVFNRKRGTMVRSRNWRGSYIHFLPKTHLRLFLANFPYSKVHLLFPLTFRRSDDNSAKRSGGEIGGILIFDESDKRASAVVRPQWSSEADQRCSADRNLRSGRFRRQESFCHKSGRQSGSPSVSLEAQQIPQPNFNSEKKGRKSERNLKSEPGFRGKSSFP